ncbi:RpiR family transcriptional regulator, partial [Burkholderia contaminans]
MSSSETPPATLKQVLQHLTQAYDALTNPQKMTPPHLATHRDLQAVAARPPRSPAVGRHPQTSVRATTHLGITPV